MTILIYPSGITMFHSSYYILTIYMMRLDYIVRWLFIHVCVTFSKHYTSIVLTAAFTKYPHSR